MMTPQAQLAHRTLAFLNKAPLEGSESDDHVTCKQWLRQIANGTLKCERAADNDAKSAEAQE